MPTALERLRTLRTEEDENRAELSRLHEYIIRLRCENPKKDTRKAALTYAQAQINRFGHRLNGASGYDDPDDPFAEDAMIALQDDFNELVAYGNPYPVPLPEGCILLPQANFDPFEYGRLYNGKVSGMDTEMNRRGDLNEKQSQRQRQESGQD